MLLRCFHLLAQAQWPHVSPYFLNESQAFGFRSTFPGSEPAERIISMVGPDRILLFMVDDNFVDGSVFLIMAIHVALSLLRRGDNACLFQDGGKPRPYYTRVSPLYYS